MAIVKMNKISIVGLDSVRPELLENLMNLGVVELNSQEAKMTDENWSGLVTKDGNEDEVSRYDLQISKIALALETTAKYAALKKPLFKTRRLVDSISFRDILADRASIWEKVEQVLSLYYELNDLKSAENKVEANQLSLKPWATYDAPVELQNTRYASIAMGVIPSVANLDKLRTDIAQKTELCMVNLVSSDADLNYLSIICLKEEQDDVLEILKQYGFNRVNFKDIEGTPAECAIAFEKQKAEIGAKRTEIEAEIALAIEDKEKMECLHDHMVMKRDQAKAQGRFLRTKRSFYADGWLPVNKNEATEELLKKYDCYYEISEPEEGDDVPILLKNNSLVLPFEGITNLYSKPQYKSVDPTPFIAPFYFIFFGIMYSDAAYGFIMALVCFLILKKFRLEGMAYRLIKMFMFVGISTVIWGALFGSWFGNLVYAVSSTFFNHPISIPPLWFDPLADPFKLLIFSFAIGAFQLLLGMGIKGYISIREGHPIDAICDVGFWYVLFAGLAMLVIPGTSEIGKWVAIIGAAGLALTGGRNNKGIVGKFTGGFGTLYGITAYIGDVLSYARLLALGLSTGVIAQVMNTIGTLAGNSIVGVILMIVVGLIGHTFNMAINGLGSFVHAARLQYVEFFGKFLESGGTPFIPFDRKTKYVCINEEEN